MAAYIEIYLHIIFGTKNRQALLHPDIDGPLHEQLREIATNSGDRLIVSGGGDDHRHLLVSTRVTRGLGALVGDLKAQSSKWLKTQIASWRGWQAGYSAFSLQKAAIKGLKRYILNQRRHHASEVLEAELDRFKGLAERPRDPRTQTPRGPLARTRSTE